jgi:hypothetical protein
MSSRIKVKEYDRSEVLRNIDHLPYIGNGICATWSDERLRKIYKNIYPRYNNGEQLEWADEAAKDIVMFHNGGIALIVHPSIKAEVEAFLEKNISELNSIGSMAMLDFIEGQLSTEDTTVVDKGGIILIIHPTIEDEMLAFVTQHEDDLEEIGSKATLNFEVYLC